MVPHERADRLQRLAQLRSLGVEPYPAHTRRTHTIPAVLAEFDVFAAQGSITVVAGRVRAIRAHGGSTFLVIEEARERMQAYVKRDVVGAEAYAQVDCFDVGDFVEVEGTCFRTKTNEATIAATRCTLLTKSLMPLPEKWHGLTDTETRYRHREMDLLANPQSSAYAVRRGQLVDVVRSFFRERGFLEVETPMLHPIPGGANARPFITHHHALAQDFYLRIAPELYLKRLVVGGLDRVFEFARCFRNEGVDRNHNPEFTQIEAYQAYADYRAFMELVEGLFLDLATKILAQPTMTYAGKPITMTPPFPRRPFRELVREASGVDIAQTSDDGLRDALQRRGVTPEVSWSRGKLLDELYKETARPQLWQPTFVIDHPVELSPLAKRKPEDPNFVERFQLVIAGMEVVNAFSELNDPLDQRARFEEQQAAHDAGDEEAQVVDEDYLHALEIGLPPTAGLGVGIDRLAMLLMNAANLKEVILFPTLRRKPDVA